MAFQRVAEREAGLDVLRTAIRVSLSASLSVCASSTYSARRIVMPLDTMVES
jgi:hypothetical protein